jgi:hypothetical protein
MIPFDFFWSLQQSPQWTAGYLEGVFLGALIMGISILTSRRFKWIR